MNKTNDINGTQFGVVAQLYAHLNWIALVKNDRMHCLKTDAQCPVLDVNVVGKSDLKCVFGVAFTNSLDANTFVFFLVNSCHGYDMVMTWLFKTIMCDIRVWILSLSYAICLVLK